MTPFDLTLTGGGSARQLRWISLREPDLQATRAALAELGLPQSLTERLAHEAELGVRRPSLRSVEGVDVLALRLLAYHDAHSSVESGELRMVVGDDTVLTVTRPPAGDESFLTSGAVEQACPVDGPAAVALVLGVVVEKYEWVCAELEIDVEEVEESVFSTTRTDEAERIYALKREVAEVRRAVVPLLETLGGHVRPGNGAHTNGGPGALGAVAGSGPAAPDRPVAPSTRSGRVVPSPELFERLHRVAESVDTITALLNSVFEAYVALISIQQNSDMRRISAAAALVVVPTLVAGVYGMNFRHMPELDWTYGYPMALGFMATTVVALSVFFRRVGWF